MILWGLSKDGIFNFVDRMATVHSFPSEQIQILQEVYNSMSADILNDPDFLELREQVEKDIKQFTAALAAASEPQPKVDQGGGLARQLLKKKTQEQMTTTSSSPGEDFLDRSSGFKKVFRRSKDVSVVSSMAEKTTFPLIDRSYGRPSSLTESLISLDISVGDSGSEDDHEDRNKKNKKKKEAEGDSKTDSGALSSRMSKRASRLFSPGRKKLESRSSGADVSKGASEPSDDVPDVADVLDGSKKERRRDSPHIIRSKSSVYRKPWGDKTDLKFRTQEDIPGTKTSKKHKFSSKKLKEPKEHKEHKGGIRNTIRKNTPDLVGGVTSLLSKTKEQEKSDFNRRRRMTDQGQQTALLEVCTRIGERVMQEQEIMESKKVFGVDLRVTATREGTNIPRIIADIVAYLTAKEERLKKLGILRIAGNETEMNEIIWGIDTGKIIYWEKYLNVHSVVGVLKKYLKRLPQPVISFDYWNEVECIMKNKSDSNTDGTLTKIIALVNKLPKVNYTVLHTLLSLCSKIAGYSEQNRMNVSNIAVIMGPNLCYPKDQDLGDPAAVFKNIEYSNSLIELLIEHFTTIFSHKPVVDKVLREENLGLHRSNSALQIAAEIPAILEKSWSQNNLRNFDKKSTLFVSDDQGFDLDKEPLEEKKK